MVDNSVFSPNRLTIPIDPAYPSLLRELSILLISSREDPDGLACVLVSALVLPHTLPDATLAPVLAPS